MTEDSHSHTRIMVEITDMTSTMSLLWTDVPGSFNLNDPNLSGADWIESPTAVIELVGVFYDTTLYK